MNDATFACERDDTMENGTNTDGCQAIYLHAAEFEGPQVWDMTPNLLVEHRSMKVSDLTNVRQDSAGETCEQLISRQLVKKKRGATWEHTPFSRRRLYCPGRNLPRDSISVPNCLSWK